MNSHAAGSFQSWLCTGYRTATAGLGLASISERVMKRWLPKARRNSIAASPMPAACNSSRIGERMRWTGVGQLTSSTTSGGTSGYGNE
jgi:hypothetical protein